MGIAVFDGVIQTGPIGTIASNSDIALNANNAAGQTVVSVVASDGGTPAATSMAIMTNLSGYSGVLAAAYMEGAPENAGMSWSSIPYGFFISHYAIPINSDGSSLFPPNIMMF
jgi:hypothetical protein